MKGWPLSHPSNIQGQGKFQVPGEFSSDMLKFDMDHEKKKRLRETHHPSAFYY